jgi:hypothetical protein
MLSWSRRDGDFDLGVCGSEFGKRVAEERTKEMAIRYEKQKEPANKAYFMPFELPAQSQ